LEDSEWSRLALGIAGGSLAFLGTAGGIEALQLDPDSITLYLSVSAPPPWPFTPGRMPGSWKLPRDSRLIASVPLTPSITTAARKAALVTVAEAHGRRALVDLVAVSSTLLRGSPAEVGTKIAEIAVELGSRRWSDLGTLILVALDRGPRRDGIRHVRDVAAALEEVSVCSMGATGSTSICVVVPPWASDPADPLISELVRLCEQTDDVGVLCCGSKDGALCLWELSSPAGQSALSFGDGRRLPGVALEEVEEPAVKARIRPLPFELGPASKARVVPIEVAVLGGVQVNGAPESFRYRRRLTELVAVNADRKQERAPVENGSTLSLKLLGDLSLVHRLAA